MKQTVTTGNLEVVHDSEAETIVITWRKSQHKATLTKADSSYQEAMKIYKFNEVTK